MGTRLLSEYLIKSRYPHIRYVRIHTRGKNTATIYAWNEELELPERDAEALRSFAAGHLVPYVCFQVKAYPLMKDERVPDVFELPATIQEAAMSRNLSLNGIVGVINGLFTGGVLTYSKYDPIKGKIYFDLRTNATVTDVEKALIERYLYEVVPLGSSFEVIYG